MNDVCSIELLRNAVARGLSADEETALHAHLEHCEACCAQMEQLAGGETWQQEAAALLSADELDAAVPEPANWSEVDFGVEHLDPSDDANVLGQLGGYDVLAIVGRGGMGVVLKAFDRDLKRLVAIKALAPYLAHSSVARKRFAREARAAAAVVNPHVIAIHHVQPTGRLPFLIMPLLTGESLAQRLKARGSLELTEVLRIGMQAAAGLAAAHDQGLVHRDVKPANIFLEKGVERVVITDFGLARAADDVSMTRQGVVAGTPEYMSPEQARGEALDGRSDLFSLGCVLYEMATGMSPFRTDSTIATLRRVVDEQPAAMASLAPELPPWFSRIVERLLSKYPAQRFASASEVSHLLEQCLSHLQQPTSVPLPASLVPHATGRGSIFNVTQKGVLAMICPPVVEFVDGKKVVSRRGICLTGLVVSALSVVGFLGFRFAFNVILGSTVDLFPGILLAATIPTGLVLGSHLRTQLSRHATSRRSDSSPRRTVLNSIFGTNARTLLILAILYMALSCVAFTVTLVRAFDFVTPNLVYGVSLFIAGIAATFASTVFWCIEVTTKPSRLASGPVSDASEHRSIANSRRAGVLAMLGTLAAGLLGMVLWQATEAPDISGQWTSDEWGAVVLEDKGSGKYAGTFSGPSKGQPASGHALSAGAAGGVDGAADTSGGLAPDGTITGSVSDKRQSGKLHLKWSRVERRFNGTWGTGDHRNGKISLRLVDNEIRGAWTTAKDAQKESGTPRLADLLWKRSQQTASEVAKDVSSIAEKQQQAEEVRRATIANKLRQLGQSMHEKQNKVIGGAEDAPDAHWREYGVTPTPVTELTAKVLESIGLHLSPITKDSFREKNVFAKYSGGLDVTFVQTGGSAEKAGIHEEDIVVKLQGRLITRLSDLDNTIQQVAEQIERKGADSLQFDVLRSGETVRVNVPFSIVFSQSTSDQAESPTGLKAPPAIERPLERKNARAVVEAFVAAILARDQQAANALARNNPSEPGQPATNIEYLIKYLPPLQRLPMKSVYVFDNANPPKAMALSEVFDWDHRRTPAADVPDWPDLILRLELNKSEQGWHIIEAKLDRKVRADEEFKEFYESPEKGAAMPATLPTRLNYFTTGQSIKIACSADGKLIAVANGNPTRILQTDGTSRVLGDWKPTADILDAETGNVVVSLNLTTVDEDAILAATEGLNHLEATALAFSPAGNLVAGGTSIGHVKLFNVQTGELVLSLDDEPAKLGEQKTPEKLKSLKRAMGSIGSLAFSPDGTLLAMAGSSFDDAARNWGGVSRLGELATGPGRLKVWEVKTGALIHDLVGHSHANAIAFSPDGNSLASAGSWLDGGSRDHGSGVILWHPKTGAKLRTFPINTNGGTWSVAFSPNSKLVAISSRTFDKDNDTSTSSISLLRTATGILEWKQTVSSWGQPVAFSPDGKSVAVLCGGQSIRFVDTDTGTLKHDIRLADASQGARWNDFALAPKGRRLAIAGVDNSHKGGVQIWDFAGPNIKAPAIERPVDRKNARSVVEAYVALALAGELPKAGTLAKGNPAESKRIEIIARLLNVNRVIMTSVYVDNPAEPFQALATSEAVELEEKQPDGRRKGFLVLTLTMTYLGWFVTDIDFESEQGAEAKLKKFLEANPSAIGSLSQLSVVTDGIGRDSSQRSSIVAESLKK